MSVGQNLQFYVTSFTSEVPEIIYSWCFRDKLSDIVPKHFEMHNRLKHKVTDIEWSSSFSLPKRKKNYSKAKAYLEPTPQLLVACCVPFG